MFAAASTSAATRDLFISNLVNFLQQTPTSRPWTDLYDTVGGDYGDGIVFTARPVMGGVFTLLVAKPDFAL